MPPRMKLVLPPITFDAGHGGDHTGAVTYFPGTKIPWLIEAALNWSVVGKVCVEANVASKCINETRVRPWDAPNLEDRAEFANSKNSNLFVSVHFNAAEDPSAHGIEVLYHPGSKENRSMIVAERMQDILIRMTSARDRGIKPREDLVVLNKTLMPAVLVECGFISNPEEASYIAMDSYLDCLAAGIWRGTIEGLKAIGVRPKMVPLIEKGVPAGPFNPRVPQKP